MNWRVILRPKAEADLHAAWLWYESQRSGLGDELLLEIGSAVRQLETDPERRPFNSNLADLDSSGKNPRHGQMAGGGALGLSLGIHSLATACRQQAGDANSSQRQRARLGRGHRGESDAG